MPCKPNGARIASATVPTVRRQQQRYRWEINQATDGWTDRQTGQHPVELERRCNSRTLPVNDNMMIILLGPQNVAVAAMTAAAKSPQLMYPTGKLTARQAESEREREWRMERIIQPAINARIWDFCHFGEERYLNILIGNGAGETDDDAVLSLSLFV